jgi:protein arginine kinase activator
MTCQDCKERQAQVHFTQILNNEKLTLALCKKCAAARGFHSPLESMPFPLAEILDGLVDKPARGPDPEIPDTLSCSGCGLTFQEFARQGRFGCGQCYKAFRSRLQPIMRKIHGASLHRGKMPEAGPEQPTDDKPIPVREEERLESELRKAIDSEDFERAAEIRDKLRALKEEVGAEL